MSEPVSTSSAEPPVDPALKQEIDAARRAAKREKLARRSIGVSGRIAAAFLESKLTPLLVVASLLIGGLALLITPREEEPQIKVPMVDVTMGFPGATPAEVERRVITPLEKALYEIENVEYIYSTSRPSGGMVIVRFFVGTDPDQAVTRIYSKLQSIADQLPAGATAPLVKLRTIDDVPSAAYTLWSASLSSTDLRRVAAELKAEFMRHPRVSQVTLIGGQRRVVRVTFDRDKLAAYQASLLQAYGALAGANWRLPAGELVADNTTLDIHIGGFLSTTDDVRNLLVVVYSGKPVYVRDVAAVEDGPEEPDQ